MSADIMIPDPFVVVFTPGSSEETCIDLPITSDNELEDDHDFSLAITGAGSAPHASVNNAMAALSITINDDERECLCMMLHCIAIQNKCCF